jgi:outer membrane protein assembly factor BamB
MSNLVIPSPFAANDMLYITSGYVGDAQRPVHAIKPGASGDVFSKVLRMPHVRRTDGHV